MGVGKGLCGVVLQRMCDQSTLPWPRFMSFYEVLGEEWGGRMMLGKNT